MLLLVGESSAPVGADPIAMMEFYMKKAAWEERRRQPKQSKDEMPPPASLQSTNMFFRIDVLVVTRNIFVFAFTRPKTKTN